MKGARGTWLFVLPWHIDAIGGINQVVLNLFKHVKEDGAYRPALLVTAASDQDTPARDDCLTIRMHIKGPYSGGGVRSILSYVATLPYSLFTLYRLLRKSRASVVNVHGVSISVLSFAILRALGLYRGRLILSFHGFDILQAESEAGFRRHAWRFIIAMSDAVIAVSKYSHERLTALWPRARCVIIHNGIDPDLFVGKRDPAFDLPENLRTKTLLVSIGTFDPVKGHDTLIFAFGIAAKASPDLHLLIAGRSTEYRRTLETMVSQSGLDGRVTFLSDLPHARIGVLLMRARLFILPSRKEQFPIVLLEAGLYRLPVIASDVGGIPEIIVNDETGRLVPPNRPEVLAQSIVDLLNDAERGQRLGAALDSRVRKSFSWSRAFQKYKACAEQHIADRHGSASTGR